MNDITDVIRRCQALGATFTPAGKRIRVHAPQPLPDDLVAALKEAKIAVLDLLERERRDAFDKWILQEWRYISIPQWRRILRESIENRDIPREKYARRMLTDVLEDCDTRIESDDAGGDGAR